MEILKMANLGIRFLLELCLLAALGYWGFHAGKVGFVKWLLGIGAPLLAAVAWGTFLSPKASIPVSMPVQLVMEAVLFGIAAAGLYAAGRPSLAFPFAFIVVINRVLMIVWNQ
ncbi:DUF2568 domain-containing protein [Cohnella sp. CFH 77786]|uniref:YrdB family protein n=1 Tax=Cohnella sp. CFH 77786 TaxID=2662265 RepID=UPI001C609C97|nr:YrdB family protein [Cohnella sp. CFH 77786]MBW5448026.1 DUF2568 domain-containing protein [Cohnella sp. CFH 77786]